MSGGKSCSPLAAQSKEWVPEVRMNERRARFIPWAESEFNRFWFGCASTEISPESAWGCCAQVRDDYDRADPHVGDFVRGTRSVRGEKQMTPRAHTTVRRGRVADAPGPHVSDSAAAVNGSGARLVDEGMGRYREELAQRQ